jgi:hypothetical protein
MRSTAVEATPHLSCEATPLLEKDVARVTESTPFVSTKAGQAVVEMTVEATKDARIRAEQIATQGNRGMKELRAARMGIPQINPLYSRAVSREDNNDNLPLEKPLRRPWVRRFHKGAVARLRPDAHLGAVTP